MDVGKFVQSVEAAQRQYLPSPAGAQEPALRQQLGAELQRLEDARIAEGLDSRAARHASCRQVKVLHDLGYPVDFTWLHEPVATFRAG